MTPSFFVNKLCCFDIFQIWRVLIGSLLLTGSNQKPSIDISAGSLVVFISTLVKRSKQLKMRRNYKCKENLLQLSSFLYSSIILTKQKYSKPCLLFILFAFMSKVNDKVCWQKWRGHFRFTKPFSGLQSVHTEARLVLHSDRDTCLCGWQFFGALSSFCQGHYI